MIPDCFCSVDGSKIPGDLEIAQVPQMISLSFNGAINVDNIPIYQEIFAEGKYLQMQAKQIKTGVIKKPLNFESPFALQNLTRPFVYIDRGGQ